MFNIDFSRIKLPKWLFGHKDTWFKNFGLHHASVTAVVIALGHLIGLGSLMAAIMVGWYASREYGGQTYPPKSFEVMDFVAPVLVAIIYALATQ